MRFLKEYNSIDQSYFFSDCHIHTNRTDGNNSIEEVIGKAESLNLRTIAITDHIRENSDYFYDYAEKIKKLRNHTNVNIIIGFEAKIKDFNGHIDVSIKSMQQAELKIASVHRFPLGRKLYSPKDFSKNICQEIELELSIAALKKGGFDVLGHPGGMSLRNYGEFPIIFFEEIIFSCKKSNIAFDINCAYHAKVIDNLLPLLKEYNPMVVFGSDSHNISEIGGWLKNKNKFII